MSPTSIQSDYPIGARWLHTTSDDRPLPVLALYPSHAVAHSVAFGPYALTVAMDAPIAPPPLASGWPVAVISHGNNGSPFTHRGTAERLVAAGFVVLLPEHVGNSRSDAALVGTVTLLSVRPQQLVSAVRALHADDTLGPVVDATRRVLIGHSIGAYTVLAASGGTPVNTVHDQPPSPPALVSVAHLDGVRALILLAPAAAWFLPPARLDGVRAPVRCYRGARDLVTPAFHTEIIRRGLAPDHPFTEIEVPDAGHFSFQTPFPPAMHRPDFAPAHDPPGFDRPSFHARLNDEIAAWAHAQID